jgi:hypothetical protein
MNWRRLMEPLPQKAPQNAERPPEVQNWIVFEIVFVPTEGTRLPIVRSGNFGRLPFSGQLSVKQGAWPYTDTRRILV